MDSTSMDNNTIYDTNTTTLDNSSNSTNYEAVYCGIGVQNVANGYTDYVHVYAAPILCIFGIITNQINIVVLYKRPMRKSSVNLILLALAITDFLVCGRELFQRLTKDEWRGLLQLPYSGLNYKTFGHLIFGLFLDECFYVFHMWSVYLTVLVGLWRHLAVLYPLKSISWLTRGRTKIAIFATLIVALAIFLTHLSGCTLEQRTIPANYTIDDVPPKFRPIFTTYSYRWKYTQTGTFHFYMLILVFIKILPICAMIWTTFKLTRSLASARRTRKQMSQVNKSSSAAVGTVSDSSAVSMSTIVSTGLPPVIKAGDLILSNPDSSSGQIQRRGPDDEDQTSRMLLRILIIFLATEIPAAVFSLVTVIIGGLFYDECYLPFHPMMNFVELISSSTSFFVYFTMSRNYRNNLPKSLVKLKTVGCSNLCYANGRNVDLEISKSYGKTSDFDTQSTVVTTTEPSSDF